MSMGYNSKMRISNKFIGRMRFAFSKSSVFKASILLNRSDRLKLSSMAVFQVILGFLDIAGVLFLGALGALSVQGIEARPPGNKVSVFLKILGIKHLTFQHQVAFLGTTSAILLISKTLISAYYSRKTLFFLTRKSSEISGIIISKILSQDIVQLQRLTSQETLYIVTNGVNGLLIGILGSVITIIADSIMLIILTMALFFTDPILAISTSGIFLVTGFLLYYFLQVRASEIGKLYQELTIANNQKLLEVLESYRETIVRDRRSFYVKEIQSLRRQLSTVFAELSFQPYISKYVIELTSIISALLLAAYEFDTKDAVHAVAVLVVFLAASSRIAPSVLRIQQGFLAIKSNEGSSEITFRLLSEIEKVKVEDSHFNEPLFEYPDFVPNVSLREINFAYDNSESFRLSGINLDISAGSTVVFTNHDNIYHNINSKSPANLFSIDTYDPGTPHPVTFEKSGEVQLLCKVHPEMSGWVIVTDNQYAAVTEHDGKFSISDIPEGTYEIAVWSEKLKLQNKTTVTVAEGKTTSVVLQMSN